MRSLRRRLLISLWIAVMAVGVLSAAIAYVQVSRQARDLLDKQLEQIATLVAAGGSAIARPPASEDSDIEVATWGADGTLLYSSSPLLREERASRPGFSEILLGGERYRLHSAMRGGLHVEVAQPVDVRDDRAESAALSALLPILLLMPVLAIVIAFVIRALLQPVRDLAATVARRDTFASEALQGQGLPSEVTPLVDEINKLLARQREAAQRERDFIADAAHALRTPLAALQLQADVLDGSSEPSERAARLTDLRAGIQRAARLSQQLLSLARTELAPEADMGAIDLDAALQEVHGLYAPSASHAAIELNLEAHSQARVRGDVRRLILIFGNLLENALRYTPAHGRIEVRVLSAGGIAMVEVCDQGPGLTESELARVFERFHRAPNDASAGSGLGLATVQSLVRQLGGGVSLHNRTDERGLIARVSLPCAQAPV